MPGYEIELATCPAMTRLAWQGWMTSEATPRLALGSARASPT